jgi:uncharacterized membrane protein (DUF106 family)
MNRIIILIILVVSSIFGVYLLGKRSSDQKHLIDNQNAVIESKNHTDKIKELQDKLDKKLTNSSRSANIERLRKLSEKQFSNQ